MLVQVQKIGLSAVLQWVGYMYSFTLLFDVFS